MVWIKFLISIGIIFYCGRKLSQYGDIISKKTGLGGGFIGVILLGAVTSLPELITTISSVAFVKEVNLAWGNILGSNLLNLTILACSDIIIKRADINRVLDDGNILTGCFSIIITAVCTIGLITGKDIILLGHVSIYSVAVLLIYFLGSFILYKNAVKSKTVATEEDVNGVNVSNLKLFSLFLLNAALIILAGVSVTYACDEIAKITGLGATFVGTLFLAIATSLPEIVVSVSAIRLGLISMAAGNILGSNFFNISILGVSDFFYKNGSGSLFLDASKINLLTSTIFIIVTNIILIGMLYRSKKKLLRFGYDSIIVIILYLMTFYYLYRSV